MLNGLKREVPVLGLFASLSLITSFATGHIQRSLIAGLLAYVVWLLWSLGQFVRWISDHAQSHPPRAGALGEASDAIERERRRQQRQIEEIDATARHLRDSLGALEDGVLILAPNNTIGWANPAAGRLLELQLPQDLGGNLLELIRDPDLAGYIANGKFNAPIEFESGSRTPRQLEARVAVFGKNNKIAFIRDVTTIKRLQTVRRDFAGNVSHELRTPLTVISGYLDTLIDLGCEPKDVCDRVLGEMRVQARRMSSLIRDLMLLSSLENEASAPHFENIQLRPLLESIRENALASSSGDKEISLDCPPALSYYGNHQQLESIFSNLVINAVKYTGEGARIHIRCLQQSGQLRFTVEDNGIGIDPIHIPRLTERFYRVDPNRANSLGGSGLGLAIVKHALRFYDGDLQIDSMPGRGSTFTCLLPLPKREKLAEGA